MKGLKQFVKGALLTVAAVALFAVTTPQEVYATPGYHLEVLKADGTPAELGEDYDNAYGCISIKKDDLVVKGADAPEGKTPITDYSSDNHISIADGVKNLTIEDVVIYKDGGQSLGYMNTPAEFNLTVKGKCYLDTTKGSYGGGGFIFQPIDNNEASVVISGGEGSEVVVTGAYSFQAEGVDVTIEGDVAIHTKTNDQDYVSKKLTLKDNAALWLNNSSDNTVATITGGLNVLDKASFGVRTKEEFDGHLYALALRGGESKIDGGTLNIASGGIGIYLSGASLDILSGTVTDTAKGAGIVLADNRWQTPSYSRITLDGGDLNIDAGIVGICESNDSLPGNLAEFKSGRAYITSENEQTGALSGGASIFKIAENVKAYGNAKYKAAREAVRDNIVMKAIDSGMVMSYIAGDNPVLAHTLLLGSVVKVSFETDGGSTVDDQMVILGEKVSKPVDPTKNGCKFAGWYKDEKFETEWNFDENVVKEDVTIYAKWETDGEELPFKDVEDKWYKDAIKFVYKNKIMEGTSKDTFEPDTPCNREMMVKIFHNAEGQPEPEGKPKEYTDKVSAWAEKAIQWGYETGVTDGTSLTTFGPKVPLSRQQVARFIYNYAKYCKFDLEGSSDLKDYKDADKVSKWALEAMKWANANGIVQGKSATVLDPKGKATRAEVAQMLMNFYEKYKKDN